MLDRYYNSAILRVREEINGIDKLERLKTENKREYLKRRNDYINRMIRNKKRKGKNASKSS